jgi:hypothetical protein
MHVARPTHLIERTRRPAKTASIVLGRAHLQRERWRRGKHGYTCRLARIVRNGIAVARVHTSSMLANTCCTTLLIQGAPAPLAATTPP